MSDNKIKIFCSYCKSIYDTDEFSGNSKCRYCGSRNTLSKCTSANIYANPSVSTTSSPADTLLDRLDGYVEKAEAAVKNIKKGQN